MELITAIAPILAEQYADMLALDFRARQALLTSCQHNISHLQAWDMRLQAYLDGLLLLRGQASAYFEAQLASPLSRGDFFALGAFAAYSDSVELLEGCCRLAQAMPQFLPVMGSVMEWAPTGSALWAYLDNYPPLRLLALWHRPDITLRHLPGQTDMTGMLTQPALIPALVNTLHYQAHPDYHAIVETLLQSADPRILSGALSAILTRNLPDGGQLVQALLRQLMQARNAVVRLEATQLSLLCTGHSQNETLAFIETHTHDTRLYIQALGIAGSVAHIDRLRTFLADPDYARLSAAAISMIAGVRPEAAGWASCGPGTPQHVDSSEDMIPDEDPDAALSWPDVPAFDRWWHRHGGNFDPATAYLGGQPATEAGMLAVLQNGSLALRPLAALRLQHLTARPICSLSAPADSQQQSIQRLMNKDNPV